jgi:hypothetical protein
VTVVLDEGMVGAGIGTAAGMLHSCSDGGNRAGAW